MGRAAYDEIAQWYETEFLAGQAGRDPIGVAATLGDLLGPGRGRCLEVGCGTGTHAGQLRGLGWTPVGVDLSAGMLRYAAGRLPVARADAARLPVRDACLGAVVAVMVHTDMPAYPAVLAEVARVLRPGVRDKVGAVHRPLPELLHAFSDAGLALVRFAEGGAPTPTVLAVRARRPG